MEQHPYSEKGSSNHPHVVHLKKLVTAHGHTAIPGRAGPAFRRLSRPWGQGPAGQRRAQFPPLPLGLPSPKGWPGRRFPVQLS